MVRRSAKNIRQLLQHSHIGGLQQRTEQFQLWQRLWQECVPAELARHCRCTAVHSGSLKISVSSAVWTPRLRMLEPHIIDYFNQFLEQPVQHCEIKVEPDLHQQVRKN